MNTRHVRRLSPGFYRHMAIRCPVRNHRIFTDLLPAFLTDLPPLTTLVHLHGVVFTAWLLVFMAQTRLVAAQRVDLHMKLGICRAGAVLVIVAISFATAASGPRPAHPPFGLTPPQFTIVGIISLVLFAGFLALGIAFRRRARIHKRFMVLAMIAVLTPAASRDGRQLGLREHWTYLVPIFPALFVAWCLAYDWRKQRIVHPVYAVGGAAIIASWPLRIMIGRSEWYQPVGEWIARIGAGLQ